MINNELSFLLPRAFLFDIIIYLATLPLFKFGLEMPLGLIFGTLAMLINFVLLGTSSERLTERVQSSGHSERVYAKRYMFRWYVLRMLILAIFVYLAIIIPYISLFGAALPLLFPKLAYTLNSVYINLKANKK